MRSTMRYLIAALLLLAGGANAEPITPLQPMSFLAGHCWKGQFPDGKQTDEHCFSWLFDGRALRDTHTVRAAGRPDYVGETTYYWDVEQKRVAFLYIENLGGVSRGTMEPVAEGLVFPAARYVAGNESMTYRVRWTRQGDDAYEAFSEMQGKDGWITMFRLVLRRMPS
jgi:hypothetical protein